MSPFIKKHHRVIFYISWILIGLFQAYFTELQDDEAYYWIYSHYLAWGYFDHPPMIALMIKAGTIFFTNELSIRFFPLLLNTLTLLITEKLCTKKDPFVFYTICLSMIILQLAGFFAVPDIPLVFFTSLLFLVYKWYAENADWKNSILLGVIAACLMYSKYHGALVILFIILSNIRLLKDPKIYASGFLCAILFFPHIYWQYQHNWITFRYHLFERSADDYDLLFTSDYLLGQLLIAGPLMGILFWPISFIYRPANKLEKALKFTAIGFFLFFLISTLKGRVEANWTAPALIPLIVLSHQFFQGNKNWKRWFIILAIPSILIILAARILTIINIVPADPITERYFAWKQWPAILKKETNSLPVVFNSNYQRASKYQFYTGQLTYSLNSYTQRQNNYNFWPIEDSLLGKAVYVMDIYSTDTFQHRIQTPLWQIGYSADSRFHSYSKIQIRPERKKYTVNENNSLKINFSIDIPSLYLSFLEKHPEEDEPIIIGLFKKDYKIKDIYTGICINDIIKKNITDFSFNPQLLPGSYSLIFAIRSSDKTFTKNSDRVVLEVK